MLYVYVEVSDSEKELTFMVRKVTLMKKNILRTYKTANKNRSLRVFSSFWKWHTWSIQSWKLAIKYFFKNELISEIFIWYVSLRHSQNYLFLFSDNLSHCMALALRTRNMTLTVKSRKTGIQSIYSVFVCLHVYIKCLNYLAIEQ